MVNLDNVNWIMLVSIILGSLVFNNSEIMLNLDFVI